MLKKSYEEANHITSDQLREAVKTYNIQAVKNIVPFNPSEKAIEECLNQVVLRDKGNTPARVEIARLLLPYYKQQEPWIIDEEQDPSGEMSKLLRSVGVKVFSSMHEFMLFSDPGETKLSEERSIDRCDEMFAHIISSFDNH